VLGGERELHGDQRVWLTGAVEFGAWHCVLTQHRCREAQDRCGGKGSKKRRKEVESADSQRQGEEPGKEREEMAVELPASPAVCSHLQPCSVVHSWALGACRDVQNC